MTLLWGNNPKVTITVPACKEYYHEKIKHSNTAYKAYVSLGEEIH